MSEDQANAPAEAPAETAAPAQAQPAPQALSINDLSVLANIIDLASSRGAFRGGELTQVGAAYEKLVGFVRGVQEQQQAAAAEQSKAKGAEASATTEEKAS